MPNKAVIQASQCMSVVTACDCPNMATFQSSISVAFETTIFPTYVAAIVVAEHSTIDFSQQYPFVTALVPIRYNTKLTAITPISVTPINYAITNFIISFNNSSKCPTIFAALFTTHRQPAGFSSTSVKTLFNAIFETIFVSFHAAHWPTCFRTNSTTL